MPAFTYRSGCLSLGERTAVMGILNVTPDSFSDGGRYTTVERRWSHAWRMEREGADLLDIGANPRAWAMSPYQLRRRSAACNRCCGRSVPGLPYRCPSIPTIPRWPGWPWKKGRIFSTTYPAALTTAWRRWRPRPVRVSS